MKISKKHYRQFASGYLIKNKKVLLVFHKKFNKWVPPGGHIEPTETPDQTVTREIYEELNLKVQIISARPPAFKGDSNATPIPMPFYIDLEREDFDYPRIGFFFFIKLISNIKDIKLQKTELTQWNWFTTKDLKSIQTFDQVREVSRYAIINYPTLWKT